MLGGTLVRSIWNYDIICDAICVRDIYVICAYIMSVRGSNPAIQGLQIRFKNCFFYTGLIGKNLFF